jgi:hypothetical protein
MGITVQSGTDVFESMLGSINYSKDEEVYPFKVRCGVVKRRPPRHDFFQYIVDMGRGDIERILEHKPLTKEVLTFVFPERWMNVREQQEFMSVLRIHPDTEKIKRVDIITSSPLLIGSFMAKQVRVLTWEDDTDGAKFLCP